MIFRLLFLLAFILPTLSFAQKATLKGIIRTPEGGPAVGVFIQQKDNTSNGTASDDNGQFTLSIPAGREVTIIFKSFTSTPFEQPYFLADGEVRSIDIEYDNTATTNEFTIIGRGSGQMQSITTKLRTSIPTINQGIEAYLIQAPVNFASELSSSYSVRGGSFDENLIYVNGIQVYRPFLVRAGEQEGLSFPNPDMVDNIKFSAGGFQSKYGDKMSSVLDIAYHRPDSAAGSFMLGLLGGSVQFEDISKNKKFTHNTGVRYKNNSYIFGTLDVSGDYRPRYYDIQTYLTYRPKEFGPWELSFLGNYANNRYNFIPQTRQTDAGNINQALRLTVFFQGEEITKFETYFGALQAKYEPNENTTLLFSGSAFNTYETEYFDILGAYRLDELERDLGSDQFGEVLRNRGVGAFLEHARNQLSASVFNFTHRGTSEIKNKTLIDFEGNNVIEKGLRKNVLSWGFDIQHENIHDELKEWTLIDSAGYASPRPPDSLGYVNPGVQPQEYIFLSDRIRATNDVISQRATAYIQDEHKWVYENGSSLTLNAGIRGNYWTFNQQFVGGPRMNLSYAPMWLSERINSEGKKDTVRKDIVLTFAAGYYWQPPFYREIRGFDGKVNPDIRAQRSLHFIGGVDYIFHAWNRPFKFTAEAYYKKLDNLIPYEVENVRLRYFATNNSHGYAYGADVMMNGEFIKGVQSWTRISYLKTMEDLVDDFYYLYLNSDGDTIQNGFTLNDVAVDSIKQVPGYIARPNDQRVSFSMLFQDEMPRRKEYKVLLNFYFATGVPYGPPSQERYLDVFRTRSYIRADIGFSRDLILEKPKKKTWFNSTFHQGTVSLEVFNLLGVNNVINHQWIEDVNGRQYSIPTYLTGRRLNLRLALKF